LIQSVLPQLTFSFYRHQPIYVDFSGGQITSDSGVLPLRSFDERHHRPASIGAPRVCGRDMGKTMILKIRAKQWDRISRGVFATETSL
jgi:hypothetical protein